MSNLLVKSVAKRKKRIGRGYGSGKGGHTVGRGQKGQKSRGDLNVLFEGVKVKKSLMKRLPLRRGRDKFKANKKPVIIKLGILNLLPQGSVVDIPFLIRHGIVQTEDAKTYGVKVLGGGEDLKKKLVIKVPISKKAAKVVEKIGGKIG